MKREYLVFKDLEESGLLARHNNLECQVIETPLLARSKKRGYLYVLTGYFPGYKHPVKKIGISDSPISRYRAICNRCPYPVFIDYLFYTPFYAMIESVLHKTFKSNRVKNQFCPSGGSEWFVGVEDTSILNVFFEADLSQKASRLGDLKKYVLDYSGDFKPDIASYFSEKINYSDLIDSIIIEVKPGDDLTIFKASPNQLKSQSRPVAESDKTTLDIPMVNGTTFRATFGSAKARSRQYFKNVLDTNEFKEKRYAAVLKSAMFKNTVRLVMGWGVLKSLDKNNPDYPTLTDIFKIQRQTRPDRVDQAGVLSQMVIEKVESEDKK